MCCGYGADGMDNEVGYDCVIIDEFHHSGAATYRKLNKKTWNGVYYRFGLTATPFRSQDHERLLLESVLSKIIYRIEYKDAVAKGYIAPLEAYYYDLPKTEIKGDDSSWPAMYSELISKNIPRNTHIADLLAKLNEAQISTLCLVKEIAHGDALVRLSGECFVYGADQSTKNYIAALNGRDINVLIGTTGVVGEGVDTKPCEYVIIAGLGKSKNALMQQFGRPQRAYPGKESGKVILFRDASHKWTLQHFKEQCKILKEEYGVVPVKLN